MALIDVQNLQVRLQTQRGPATAVRSLSFAMERGETLGLVGESGCGKSITAMSLLGLLPEGARVSGSIRFDGDELVGRTEQDLCRLRGNRIGMIFQEPMTALNPVHSIGRQVAEPLRLHRGLGAAEARSKAIAMLDRVGIPDAARRFDAYPHQFSGGQRQRITIAMALVCEPDLLIADEPTTALDVTIQAQILALIKSLQVEIGRSGDRTGHQPYLQVAHNEGNPDFRGLLHIRHRDFAAFVSLSEQRSHERKKQAAATSRQSLAEPEPQEREGEPAHARDRLSRNRHRYSKSHHPDGRPSNTYRRSPVQNNRLSA